MTLNEAQLLIQTLRARWETGGQATIAAALGVSPRMVRKVEAGQSAGNLYVPTLRALADGRPAPLPARPGVNPKARVAVDSQGRLVASHGSATGLRRVLRNAGRRKNSRARRVGIQVTGVSSSTGQRQTKTLWDQNGHDARKVWSELEAILLRNGVDPDVADEDDLAQAIAELVADHAGDHGHDGYFDFSSVGSFGLVFR